jgi:hypothetical protein
MDLVDRAQSKVRWPSVLKALRNCAYHKMRGIS